MTIAVDSCIGSDCSLTTGTWSLDYMLTDHLGSVVAVTDASGTLISQQRYLPFGGVRIDTNPPFITQTDLGYTGQRNLDAQGNVSLGLMDYHARMYDAYITQAFIQPDSIANIYNPKSLNRYAYVMDRPTILTDPSGNDPTCPSAPDMCQPPINNCSNNEADCKSHHAVDGTQNSGSSILAPNGLTTNGTPNCTRVNNTYCDGVRMYQLYWWYQSTPGWWNGFMVDNFLPADFLAMMLMFEANGEAIQLRAIETAVKNQLWGTGPIGTAWPYCSSSNCAAGIFNLLGAQVESAVNRYRNMGSIVGLSGEPAGGYAALVAAELSLQQVADFTVYNPLSPDAGNDSPTKWGAYPGDADVYWLHFAISHGALSGTTDRCGLFYTNGTDVVYTVDQNYNWDTLHGSACIVH